MTKKRRSQEVSAEREREYCHLPEQWFALSFITYLLISLGVLEHKCVNGSRGVSAVGKVTVGTFHGILPQVANIDNRTATVLICKCLLLCNNIPIATHTCNSTAPFFL
jgi:hypothetical protein